MLLKKIQIGIALLSMLLSVTALAKDKIVFEGPIGIMPVMIESQTGTYKANSLIDWFRTHRKNKHDQDGAIKSLIRDHVAFGFDDKKYTVMPNSKMDELVAGFKDDEVKPDNPFAKAGIGSLVFPRVLQVDTSRLSSNGEVLLELALDVVDSKSGKQIWSGKNSNVRIYDKRNIVAPDLKDYLLRVVRNVLQDLGKFKA